MRNSTPKRSDQFKQTTLLRTCEQADKFTGIFSILLILRVLFGPNLCFAGLHWACAAHAHQNRSAEGIEQIHLFSSSHLWQRQLSCGSWCGTQEHRELSGFSQWKHTQTHAHTCRCHTQSCCSENPTRGKRPTRPRRNPFISVLAYFRMQACFRRSSSGSTVRRGLKHPPDLCALVAPAGPKHRYELLLSCLADGRAAAARITLPQIHKIPWFGIKSGLQTETETVFRHRRQRQFTCPLH